jgi:hypothetical protein
MTMRRRAKSSSRTAKARRQTPANDRAAIAPQKRVTPPLIEQFHVAVDRQLKSEYGTYEAADKAARAIKKQYPQLQVTVYDAKVQRHTTVEGPTAGADPSKESLPRVKNASSQRRAVAGGGH